MEIENVVFIRVSQITIDNVLDLIGSGAAYQRPDNKRTVFIDNADVWDCEAADVYELIADDALCDADELAMQRVICLYATSYID